MVSINEFIENINNLRHTKLNITVHIRRCKNALRRGYTRQYLESKYCIGKVYFPI